MDLGTKNKTALVHGAGSGLGRAIACSLAAEGVKVAVASRRAETAAKTAQDIVAAGGKAFSLAWDLADLSVVEERVSRIEAELGPVDILVNNTGGPPPTQAAGQSQEVWLQQFNAMVLSVIAITDRILPGMRERKWGRVITSTSSGVIAPIPNLAISNTLRASLVGWSKTLAGEVARDGVTVNVIVPGRIASARLVSLDEQTALREGRPVEEISARNTASIPMGRYGDPKEYGDVACFLASSLASYVTGSVMRVDGGAISSV